MQPDPTPTPAHPQTAALGVLPAFQPPALRHPDPPATSPPATGVSADLGQEPRPDRPPRRRIRDLATAVVGGGASPTGPVPLSGHLDPSGDPNDPPTLTSTPGKGSNLDQADVARLAAVALAGLAAAAAALIAWRSGHRTQLRRPSKKEVRAVAEPLARIALRHFAVEKLHKDLADGIEAGTAVSDYLGSPDLLAYAVETPPAPEET